MILAVVAPIPWLRKMEKTPFSARRSKVTKVSRARQVRVCWEE